MVDLEIHIHKGETGKFSWVVGSFNLGLYANASTPRQALVNFANKLKRIKKEQLEAILK